MDSMFPPTWDGNPTVTPGFNITGVAATDVISTGVIHDYVANQMVRFTGLVGGAGLVAGTTYYIILVNATTFKVAATFQVGPPLAVNFTSNISAGVVAAVLSTTVDAETHMRHSEGQDKINYFVWQRWQGDLFKRDLVNQLSIQAVVNYLGSRSGIGYNMPSTCVVRDSYIVIGHIRLTQHQGSKGWIVGMGIKVLDTISLPVVMPRLQLWKTSTPTPVEVATLTAVNPLLVAPAAFFLAANANNALVRGTGINANTGVEDYEVRLLNEDLAVDVRVTAAFVWQASTL